MYLICKILLASCLALCFGIPPAPDGCAPAPPSDFSASLAHSTQQNFFYAPDRVEMPFELVGNLIMVRAGVDGQIGNFIVDTGAPNLLLNRAHFKGGDRPADYVSQGATGAVSGVGEVYVEAFSWEGVRLEKRQVETLDLGHVEEALSRKVLGLIGFELLRHFELKLDYRRQRLTLYRLNSFGRRVNRGGVEQPLQVVPLQLEGYVPVLRARVGNSRLRFALDSGASANMLKNKLPARVMAHFKVASRARLAGTGREHREVLAGTLEDLQVGGRTMPPMRTVLGDISPLEAAFGTSLHGVLGYEFLSRQVCSINYQRHELLFWD